MRSRPGIHEAAFEKVLQQAIVRPEGRQFRGEPARQVALLRLLREAGAPVPFDELHRLLRERGVLRSPRDDETARRKAIAQAVEAINIKLATFFFLARDVALMEEMFRIQAHAETSAKPAYSIQDFFEVRKVSGVHFYATDGDPSGGLTREMYDLITELRPHRMDLMAPSFNSFFGNPEFRTMLASALQHEAAGMRMLLLDPDSPAAARLEEQEHGETPLRGRLRDRIRATIRHAAEIAETLPAQARARLMVRLAATAPLWRFRMIFLPEVLHLRLSAPDGEAQTLIKLGRQSALYSSLHDVLEAQWREAAPAR